MLRIDSELRASHELTAMVDAFARALTKPAFFETNPAKNTKLQLLLPQMKTDLAESFDQVIFPEERIDFAHRFFQEIFAPTKLARFRYQHQKSSPEFIARQFPILANRLRRQEYGTFLPIGEMEPDAVPNR